MDGMHGTLFGHVGTWIPEVISAVKTGPLVYKAHVCPPSYVEHMAQTSEIRPQRCLYSC